VIGAVKRFAEFCLSNDPEMVPPASCRIKRPMCGHVATIDSWLDQFVAVFGRDEATKSSGEANEGRQLPDKLQPAKPAWALETREEPRARDLPCVPIIHAS
jgi:hypothetical protein